MVSDLALLEAWGAGARTAGEALFDRHFESLYAFFWNKVDAGADVDDLVQVTLLACVEGRARLRPDTNFRAYLFRVARNRLYNHWRDQRTHERIDPSVQSTADIGPSPSSLLALRGERRRLLDALRTLPADLQLTLELYYWEKLTGAELGEVFSVPEGTIRGRIRRARKLLHDALLESTESASLATSTSNGLERWADEMRAIRRAPGRR